MARKPSIAQCSQHSTAKHKWWACYGTGEIAFGKVAFGPLASDHWRKDWISQPDEAHARELGASRTKRVSPLTRIAEQLPRKLPRVPLPR